MTEMSAAEAAVVARFDAAEPAPESWRKPPLTALEWLRVTHADTLSGRRIEEAVAAEVARVLAPVWALVEEWGAAGDARYGSNRIAKSTAARVLREALPPVDGAR